MTKKLLAVMVAAICTSAYATPPNSFEKTGGESTQFSVVQKNDPRKFDLIYVSENEGPVKISIYDADGEIVNRYEVRGKNSFIQTYDFGNLEAGLYKIVLETTDGKEEQIIDFNPFRKNMNLLVHSKEDKKFRVLVAGFDKSKDVTVNIYNTDGLLVKTDIIDSQKDFFKTYDLSNIDGDSFVFTARNGNEFVTARSGT